MTRKIAFALIALWIVSLVAAILGLAPRWAELGGILLGALGLALLWLPRRRGS